MDEGNLEREMERGICRLIVIALRDVMVGAAVDSRKTLLW